MAPSTPRPSWRPRHGLGDHRRRWQSLPRLCRRDRRGQSWPPRSRRDGGDTRPRLRQFVHTSINVVAYEGYVRVAERLNAPAARGRAPARPILANSGAEAVENAVKFARVVTGRQAVIAFEHGYHGRTYMAMALTAKANPYKSGFAPFPAEVYRAAYPDFYRWPGCLVTRVPAPADAAACGSSGASAAKPSLSFRRWSGRKLVRPTLQLSSSNR